MNEWTAIGKTIRGATHLAQNKPCQDALRVRRAAHFSLACLADGHGSEHCPFSDEGALAAVETAEELLATILEESASFTEAFTTLDAHREIWLPRQLEAKWKTRIREIHEKKERPIEEPFPYSLYGTTLAALAVTSEFVFAMQIGDGDILTIDGDTPVQWLIPPEYQAGNETYSLCMDNCWQYVRAKMMPLHKENPSPVMFLLSTDGYANSFYEPQGFTKAGSDIYKLWLDNGADYIEAHLEDWLVHSSANGSGDDITMALVFN